MPKTLWSVLIAVAFVSAAAQAGPPQAAIKHYRRGLELKRAGKLEAAVSELGAAIKTYPRYMEAHYALAWVYRSLGKNDKAIEQFREVIRLAPHSPEAVESARAIQRIRLGTEAGGPERPHRIAFASTRNGNTDLYLMDTRGGSLVRLTDAPAVDDAPAWSPDGQRLAFVSDRTGDREIYVMNADGTGLRRITQCPAVDDHPVWCPVADLLAFESNRGGNFDVYVVGLAGGEPRQVTRSPADDRVGDWSPDGQQLAILSTRDGPPRVYLMTAEGADARCILASGVAQGRAVWGKNGKHIYFTWLFDRNAQICRATIDGKNLANITRSPYNDRLCDVSVDGRRLLIVSDRQKDDEIYLVEADTAAARRLTFNPGPDRDAVFAPW